MTTPTLEAAARLQDEFIGTRISFRWFGVTRSLSSSQSQQAADVFDADSDSLVASKRVIARQLPEMKALNKKRNLIRRWWIDQTLPYPDRAIRLRRRKDLSNFTDRMESFKVEMDELSGALQSIRETVIHEARGRLGHLFNEADYPSSFVGSFQVSYDFPNLNPDMSLKYMSTALYSAEAKRIQQRFEQTIELTEQMFRAQFKALLDKIVERLDGEPGPTGRKKQFQGTTITNLHDFFDRFKDLSVGTSDELDALVKEAKDVCSGVSIKDVKHYIVVANTVHDNMETISKKLSGLMVDKPKRKLRFKKK